MSGQSNHDPERLIRDNQQAESEFRSEVDKLRQTTREAEDVLRRKAALKGEYKLRRRTR